MGDTYLLDTPIGLTRLLVPDNDLDNVLFHDDEIQAFLTLEGDVRRAAAMALDVIASNEVMVLKVIATLDLKTDGTKVSSELRARADALRAQALEVDPDEIFAVAEYALPVFGWRERIFNEAWKESI